MSERGANFLVDWVEKNIGPGDVSTEGDKAKAERKAVDCLAQAEAEGLTRAELEAEVGPLAGYMNVMMSAPNEQVVQANWDDEGAPPSPSTQPS